MEPPVSNEIPASHLPYVSEDVKNHMLQELGLVQPQAPTPQYTHPTDQLMRDAIDVMSGNDIRNRADLYQRIQDNTSSIFTNVAEVNPDLVSVINGVVISKISISSFYQDQFAAGAALILEAFHEQSDFRLIYDLNKLTPSDLETIKRVFTEGLTISNGNVLERALKAPKIPPTQENLRELIEAPFKNHGSFGLHYKTGAALMYKALESVWTSLGQTPQSNTESPPPPPPAY